MCWWREKNCWITRFKILPPCYGNNDWMMALWTTKQCWSTNKEMEWTIEKLLRILSILTRTCGNLKIFWLRHIRSDNLVFAVTVTGIYFWVTLYLPEQPWPRTWEREAETPRWGRVIPGSWSGHRYLVPPHMLQIKYFTSLDQLKIYRVVQDWMNVQK